MPKKSPNLEGTPENAFGGDSPGTVVDRLWGAHLEILDQREAAKW